MGTLLFNKVVEVLLAARPHPLCRAAPPSRAPIGRKRAGGAAHAPPSQLCPSAAQPRVDSGSPVLGIAAAVGPPAERAGAGLRAERAGGAGPAEVVVTGRTLAGSRRAGVGRLPKSPSTSLPACQRSPPLCTCVGWGPETDPHPGERSSCSGSGAQGVGCAGWDGITAVLVGGGSKA